MTKWRVNIRKSADLSLIGELQANNRQLTLSHNTPGSCQWDYDMLGDFAASIQPYNTCVSWERYNWRSTLAWRNAGHAGEIYDWIWSGFVLPIKEDWPTDKMSVQCVGWGQRYAKRIIRRDKTYASNSDDGAIFQDLVGEMNLTTAPDGYVVPVPAGSNPSTPTWIAWGGMVPNEGPGGATAYVSRPSIGAGIAYSKTKYQPVLPIFDELSGVEFGCDWWVHPLSRLFYVYRKRCTSRSDVIVAYKWGPNNIGKFSRDIDANEKANYVLTTGASTTTPQYADNTTDQATNGLIESVTQLSEVTNNQVLLENSGAEIILRANGKISYGITPFQYVGDIGLDQNSVPEPFVDYDPIGDEFQIAAVHPVRGTIMGETVRSFAANVALSDTGDEQIGQLQVAP